MKPKLTALIAVIVTYFCGTLLGAFTTTPDAITQMTVGLGASLAAGAVLLVLFCTPWMRSLPAARQCRVIWFAALGTGVISCFLPLVLVLFRR